MGASLIHRDEVLRARRDRPYTRFIFRAPTPPESVGLIFLLNLVLVALLWFPSLGVRTFFLAYGTVFLAPALVAGFATPGLAALFGGRLILRRSLFLSITVAFVEFPIVIAWRLVFAFAPAWIPTEAAALLFLLAPVTWFRHMSLYGLSSPSHARSILPTLLQPILIGLGIFAIYPPTFPLVVAAVLFLWIGFLSAALLLRAADRPLRREFNFSGVSMIRPLLDHVNERDPGATQYLESFFRRFAIPADLRVTLLSFWDGDRAKATIALPTVHPGPFAALGASDLPRKLSHHLGPPAGIVFVPHTPCDHDLDLPTDVEVARIGLATRALFQEQSVVRVERVSEFLRPYEGSYARAQAFGSVALVVATQAPNPTDDIAFSVADRIAREIREAGGPLVALIDAHNSYVEDQGDVSYGTPTAEKLVRDCEEAVLRAQRDARAVPLEVGAAVRVGYRPGEHGIGPEGIKALVVRVERRTNAYVLIDGNNMLLGVRARILSALEGLVDEAEVMTTDNHVVHEVDGSINPVGERYAIEKLIADVEAVVTAAQRDIGPVELRAGTRLIPGVHVLGPTFTARLLTSLGDTLTMFTNALLTTFLLLVATSLILLVSLR